MSQQIAKGKKAITKATDATREQRRGRFHISKSKPEALAVLTRLDKALLEAIELINNPPYDKSIETFFAAHFLVTMLGDDIEDGYIEQTAAAGNGNYKGVETVSYPAQVRSNR